MVPDSAEALALMVQQLVVRAKTSQAATQALHALQQQHALALQVDWCLCSLVTHTPRRTCKQQRRRCRSRSRPTTCFVRS